MSNFAIRNEEGRKRVLSIISAQPLPFFVRVNKAIPPNRRQQQLQYHWYKELAEQSVMEAEDYDAYCKLHFGVPILRAGNDDFKQHYDEHILPLPYETKLALMSSPFSIKITERMNSKELSQYLTAVKEHFSKQGFVLTDNSAWWI